MAEAHNTLAGLVQFNDMNLADIDVNDLLQGAPLMRMITAVPASNGTLHKYLKQTVASGSAFRAVNTGILNASSQDELVTETLKLLDASFHRDKGLCLGYKGGPEAYMAIESRRALRSAFADMENQFINGTNNDANGFAGLAQETTLANLNGAQVVNAGGTTASTGSSCYLLRHAEDGVAAVMGNDGNLDVGEITSGIIKTDGAATYYHAWMLSILGWACGQYGSIYDSARIANLTADSGKGLTDDLISDAISKFKADMQPNVIVMNRRSLKQLQQSRTATNATGAPADFPSEAFGIPIVVTDQISSTETLLTT